MHHRAGRLPEAGALYRQLLAQQPADVDAWLNLGIVLAQSNDEDGACAAFETVLRLRPGDFMANNNLGLLLRTQARFAESIECFRAALMAEPHRPEVHSNLIFTMLFQPGLDRTAMAAELRAWNEHHAAPLRGARLPHTNDRTPGRRLRIGYVSPDFRDHVIGRNVLPLLREHDRAAVEIVCFSDVRNPDALTARFSALAGRWHNTAHLNHEQLAALIRHEQIDILVDLTLHLACNRLPVFARQPAPVQLSFAGYPGDTGVETITRYFTDPHLDLGHDERGMRLPNCFWCFDPLEDAPPLRPPPALANGFITFGCLNDPAKVNPLVLDLWQRVLDEVPNSRLRLLGSGTRCDQVRTRLGAARVEFTARQPRAQYLALHHEIDIALDTFPYNGHTTMCEALWMGVPMVSLAGESEVSRGGLSILTNVGLPEFVARTESDYVRIAAGLAHDLRRLNELRTSLRTRMASSPLMDAPRFARAVEASFRAEWLRWCARAAA